MTTNPTATQPSPTTTPVETSTKPTPWAGFGYAPVRDLSYRHVARFLRTQRKNVRRFFQEQGHLDLFAQMDELRKDSTRNFVQKNTTFQKILNEHISRSAPPAMAPKAAHADAAEAAHLEVSPDANLGVQDPVGGQLEGPDLGLGASGIRPDDRNSVPGLASQDVADTGLVIEE